MGLRGNKTFVVKAKDRLTGEELELSINDNMYIRTQEDAEVHVATSPTPFGGDHPGFDLTPEDGGKFEERFQQWADANPARVQALLEKEGWVDNHPEQAEKLKGLLAEAQHKADQSTGSKAVATHHAE